jgi:MFS family permease
MPLREALADSAYRASLASSFTNGWATFGVRMATVPLFAAAALGAGPEAAGWALAVFAAGNALALTFSGRLADSFGRRPMMLAGLLVTAASTAAIGFTETLPAFLAASAVSGFGSGLSGPAQQAAVADVLGRGRTGGRVLAAFQMTADTGAIVGPILAGMLADRLGYAWAFAATGGVVLLSAAFWLVSRETLDRRPGKPAAGQQSSG